MSRDLKDIVAEVLEEAIAYFDEQRAGLGDRFEQDLQETVVFATERPRTGKPITQSVRSLRLRTFRYNLIYVIDGDEIVTAGWKPALLRRVTAPRRHTAAPRGAARSPRRT
jgi:hypothetical protein